MKIISLKIFLVIVILFGFSPLALAQVRDTDISVGVSPANPNPGEDITVSVSSFSADLNKAEITWRLGGKLVFSGIGRTIFSFTADVLGKPSTIDIAISVLGSPTVNKRVVVQPGSMDLLWQAVDSYTPRFYRGKALPAVEGRIRVVALPSFKLPDGTRLGHEDFSYVWKVNHNLVPNSSGWAKNSIIYNNSYLDASDSVAVEATSRDNLYGASGQISIAPRKPQIVFYRDHPLLGTRYETALSESVRVDDRITIIAAPYFFSYNDINFDNLDFKWAIEGSPTGPSGRKNELALRKAPGQEGEANISLDVDGLVKTFQSASNNLRISF